ncbi:TPA: hypothetical protein ACGWER_001772 [Streptococcus agalactiae]|nr:hypothetical protein [Streptococcus agalactiae]HEO2267420.1 hypothetical protein [Streptococcus agalactiae]HEO7770422.1 hypothetical protein [Streptococcus agalactiae]
MSSETSGVLTHLLQRMNKETLNSNALINTSFKVALNHETNKEDFVAILTIKNIGVNPIQIAYFGFTGDLNYACDKLNLEHEVALPEKIGVDTTLMSFAKEEDQHFILEGNEIS